MLFSASVKTLHSSDLLGQHAVRFFCWCRYWQLADICAIIAGPKITPEQFFFIYVLTCNACIDSVHVGTTEAGVQLATHSLLSRKDRDGKGGDCGI